MQTSQAAYLRGNQQIDAQDGNGEPLPRALTFHK